MKYSVWHDELGMQIAAGDSVHGAVLYKAFLSWEEVSGRIHQLLGQGEYAPQEVLDQACSMQIRNIRTYQCLWKRIWRRMRRQKVQKPLQEAVPYRAREAFSGEELPAFITQDEIDAYLTKESIQTGGWEFILILYRTGRIKRKRLFSGKNMGSGAAAQSTIMRRIPAYGMMGRDCSSPGGGLRM